MDFSQAAAGVLQFAKDHPFFCAVFALGILVVLAPWFKLIGFGDRGPIEGICWSFNVLIRCFLLVGTIAASWQSKYGGNVPAQSSFAFFQRRGMTRKRKL
jgi:hypothetical protein